MRPAGGRSESKGKTNRPVSFSRRRKQKFEAMAIYHLSIKTVSRSTGRSATAAAAYRAAERITDERTGEIHDYSRKGGVESAEIILPKNAPEWASDRAALWNAAEQAETRKNSTVAREFEIALPADLTADERRRLATDFAREIVDRHGCAADVCIHAQGREGDNRNHHAHILLTTRSLGAEGFTKKTRELDDRKTGEVDRWRQRFGELQNERLAQAGSEARVDHRTLEAQGIDRAPTQHMGPAVSGMVRRGANSEVARRMGEEAAAREVGRIGRDLDRSILDLSGDLAKAKADRDRSRPTREEMDRGIADARRAYAQHKADQAAQQLKAEQEAEHQRQRQEKQRKQTRETGPAVQTPVAAKMAGPETLEAKLNTRNIQMAKSFANEPPSEAVKKFPQLAGAYATVAAINKKAEADGLDERQIAIINTKIREAVNKSIERGEIPNTKIKKEKEVTQTISNKRDYSL